MEKLNFKRKYIKYKIVPTRLRIYQCFDLEGLSSLETMTVLLLPRHSASEPECFPMDFSAFSATHVCSSHAVRLTTVHNTHRGKQTYVALMAMVVTGLTSELKSRRRRTAFLTHSFLVSISVVCLFQP